MTSLNGAQIAILVLLAGMLVIFALDRFRIEIVAISGLATGFVLGLVPAAHVFDGFANPAVITVVEILLVVQVLRQSSVLDAAARRIAEWKPAERDLILGLCATSAFISIFMNNIGALALMLPVLGTISDAAEIDLRKMLIPVSYSTLLGGMCSLIGTPANLLVSQALVAAGGSPIGFFDFAVAGVPMTLVGLGVIILWIPGRFGTRGLSVKERSRPGRNVLSELVVPQASPFAGLTLAEAEASRGLVCHTVVRDGQRVFARAGETVLAPGDLLVISGDLVLMDRLVESGALAPAVPNAPDAIRQEIVVMPESTLVGSRIGNVELFKGLAIDVLAASLRSPRIEGRLQDMQLSIGDVLVLQGRADGLVEAANWTETLHIVPSPKIRQANGTIFPPLAFAGGVALAAFGLLPPDIAFGAVLLLFLLTRQTSLRTALADINWSIVLMLAAMIPLGTAVETTGAAAGLATFLVSVLPHAGTILLAAVFLLAVLITPFVNNASTAIALAPIAIEIARSAGLSPEPFLIAVAVGASTDFLTPFGHHNNTLVMTIGGYRFSDFVKSGWPVTLAAITVGITALTVARHL